MNTLWRFVKRFPLNLVYRWPQSGLRAGWHGVRDVSRWCWGTGRYGAALFLYTSRRFLRVEGYMALAAVVLWFAFLFSAYGPPGPKGGREILTTYYVVFTIGMILLAMNLLPRERDDHTLEILWSQPFSRGGIVFAQVVSLTVWCAVLMALTFTVFGPFLSAPPFLLWVGILTLSTAFSVAMITVLISTFCRNAIATGIVAILVFGVHYYWLKNLGPINLYFNPLPQALPLPGSPVSPGKIPIQAIVINRVFVLVLLGFVYDYLLRRLRHSSAWLT